MRHFGKQRTDLPWWMRGHPLERRMMSGERRRARPRIQAQPCSAKAYRKIPVQSRCPRVLCTALLCEGLSHRESRSKLIPSHSCFARRRRRRSLRYLDAENAESEERPQYPQNVLFLGAPVLFSRLRPLFQRTSAAKPPYRGEPDPEPHPLRRCFPSAGAVPARR